MDISSRSLSRHNNDSDIKASRRQLLPIITINICQLINEIIRTLLHIDISNTDAYNLFFVLRHIAVKMYNET